MGLIFDVPACPVLDKAPGFVPPGGGGGGGGLMKRTWPREPVLPMTFITMASLTGVSCNARGNVMTAPILSKSPGGAAASHAQFIFKN